VHAPTRTRRRSLRNGVYSSDIGGTDRKKQE
jgi:hypothetical protein